MRRAREAARRAAGALFPRRFYLELQRCGLPGNESHVRAAVELAARLALPVVATHPVQFLGPDDHEAHEARVCVADGEMLANPRRVKRFSREQYFKTQAQMEQLFADLPSALANSVEIAKRCNLSLVLGKPQLPDFETPLVERRARADGRVLPRRRAPRASMRACCSSIPTRRRASASGRAMSSGSTSRSRRS